jgi:glutathione S-transferase
MTCVEKHLDYELVPVARNTEEHGALHPFRRMPILEHDGLLVFESLAITGYLDEAFPEPPLQPATLGERTRMRMWMGICGDYLFRDVVQGIPRGREPSEAALQAASTALERAESLLGPDRFLVGGQPTIADLYLAPQIANCREKQPQLLGRHDGLSRWLSVIEERPSFQATRP